MTVSEYTIMLIRSVIREEKPPEKPEEISFEELFKFISKQKLENICFAAIKELRVRPDEETLRKWNYKCSVNQAQTIAQENEKRRISEAFEEEKIHFLPMKGWLLRDMYPAGEYRFMSDIDILIHEADRKKAKAMMKRLGYTYVYGDNGKDDNYMQSPFIHVELHHNLIEQKPDNWYSYYQKIWEKVYVKEGYEGSLSWSDYYIYLIVNFVKDYTAKGSGIRSALDVFLFLKCHEADLDRSYIDNELDFLEIKMYEKNIVAVSKRWFEAGEYYNQDSMMKHLFQDGIYGSGSQAAERRLQKMLDKNHKGFIGRIELYFQRAFPGLERMSYKYPVLNKAPFLLPVFWVFRWFRHRERVILEMRTIKKMK